MRKIKKKERSIKEINPQEKIENIVNFILECRALKHLPRSYITFLKGPVKENVSEHSFYTAIIGWVLSRLENGDENKVIKMCLLHDLVEVRGGEKNLINKFYSSPLDDLKILKEIISEYHLDLPLLKLIEEFNKEKTLEAKIAKDADVLSQMLLEKECFDLGNFKAKRWLSTSVKRLKTKSGKALGKMLYEIDSDKWWLKIVRKYILKTKFLSKDEPFFHLP
jgi:putative hydrolase of HD superfamily